MSVHTVLNPATGQAVRDVASASIDETDAAVDRAVRAQRSWSALAPLERADALRRFSAAANKATGSSHPLDRTRWFAFLLSVHGVTPSLDADRLARWLVEVEGWSDDKAHDLVVEYEFGLALLDEYDRNRS